MRILWVKAGKLLPVDTGGKIRSFNLLRQLAAQHETTVLSYYAGRPDAQYEDALKGEFAHAVPMCVGGPASTAGLVIDYVRHVASSAPYAVTKFTSSRARDLIVRWMAEGKFDVMVCDFLSASLTFPDRLLTPTAIFQHNVESALWKRQASHERNPVKRAAFTLEARKMARYERDAVRRFHHVIAVSEHDRQMMSTMTDPARITVAPTGVDLSQYRRVGDHRPNDPVVMFVGSMDWEANVDGVEYFHRDMWPRIRAAIPNATFRIVGRNPAPRVQRLAEDASVEVTGRVDSVVDHMAQAAVFIVPLRIGGGTRLKIYEAMAAGRAVVSTTIGAEGLDVNDGQDILLADDATRFAESVVSLLRDENRRIAMQRAAAEHASRFDWPVVVREFEASLERTIDAARGMMPSVIGAD